MSCDDTLEVVMELYECRCGFIGDTAEEVWDHQEAQMKECVESDCSGCIDECDHCPEITTGDAAELNLVRRNDVRELAQEFQDRAQENQQEHDCDGLPDCDYCHEMERIARAFIDFQMRIGSGFREKGGGETGKVRAV